MSFSVKPGAQTKSDEKNQQKGFLSSFLTFIEGSGGVESCSDISHSKPALCTNSDAGNELHKKSCENDSAASCLVYKSGNNCDVPQLSPVSLKSTHNRTNIAVDSVLHCTSSVTNDVGFLNLSKSQLSKSKSKRIQNYDSDDELSNSSVEVTSKSSANSAPVRRQSKRLAKEKVEQRRISTIQKGKKRLSIYSEMSDSSEASDDTPELDAANRLAEYDSDKDPAWVPVAHEAGKRLRDEDDDELDTGKRKPMGQLIQRKDVLHLNPVLQSTKIAPPAVTNITLKIDASSQLNTANQKMNTCVMSSRSRTSELAPVCSKPPPNENPPHSFQKGCFVIDRRDLSKYESFPIWKIDSGRLLQKYEQVEKNGKIYHKPLSTYSSWIDDIQLSYKAIEVKFFSAMRGQELVEVVEEYWPKPPTPEPSSNESAVKESFNVYVQIFVSQSLESPFLKAIYQEPDSYYMDPLNVIDGAISRALQKIGNHMKWTEKFLDSMNQLSAFIFEDIMQIGFCEATKNSSCNAVKLVRFSGCIYQRNILEVTEELNEDKAHIYMIGADTVKVLPIYHGLQHFKMNLLNLCGSKVNEVKVDLSMAVHEILDICLSDHVWITKLMESLLQLLKSANECTQFSSC